ncbi:hypothetical protein BZG36_03665 [Bifiguratus adelaidae]|uniref:Methyltransferase domain-containing protein n=1 Tax=Bifiguratus adelaidae TaxID=1938954 RepID=A0A261XZS2_9FUNG|nr:hypothetical protein BZG36_03665 [Bifiguratus adelaidae]
MGNSGSKPFRRDVQDEEVESLDASPSTTPIRCGVPYGWLHHETSTFEEADAQVDQLNSLHWMLKLAFDGFFKSPIETELKEGIEVLDIACGAGTWVLEMADTYPQSKFHGIGRHALFPTTIKPPNAIFHTHDMLESRHPTVPARPAPPTTPIPSIPLRSNTQMSRPRSAQAHRTPPPVTPRPRLLSRSKHAPRTRSLSNPPPPPSHLTSLPMASTTSLSLPNRPPNLSLFEDNTFDFVHVRNVALAIPQDQWIPFVREIARVTKPDGWVEFAEWDHEPYNSGPRYTSTIRQYQRILVEAKRNHALPQLMPRILSTRPFKSLFGDYVSVPLAWGGPLGDLFSQYVLNDLTRGNQEVSRLDSHSEESVKEEWTQTQAFGNWWFWCAQVHKVKNDDVM